VLRPAARDVLASALSGWATLGGAPEFLEAAQVSLTRAPGEDWGIQPAEFLLAAVEPGTPAARLGLQPGDCLLDVDGKAFAIWGVLEQHLVDHVGQEHVLRWERGGRVMEGRLTQQAEVRRGEFNVEEEVVVFGATGSGGYGSAPLVPNQHRFSYGLQRTWDEAAKVFRITIMGMAGLITGNMPLKEMGGPILIAQVASRTSDEGWGYFFNVLVWISVNVGLINLLPIPILDGGHVLVFTVELLRRKPLSMKARQAVAWVGLAFILVLTALVFTNDILRNWDHIRGWLVG
jgi:regulator of sigma E protease